MVGRKGNQVDPTDMFCSIPHRNVLQLSKRFPFRNQAMCSGFSCPFRMGDGLALDFDLNCFDPLVSFQLADDRYERSVKGARETSRSSLTFERALKTRSTVAGFPRSGGL